MQQNQVIPMAEVEQNKNKVETLHKEMTAIKVTSKEELNAVAAHIGAVKKIQKEVSEVRDRYIAPAKEIIQHAKDTFDPIINLAKEAEEHLKKSAEAFMLAEKKREDDAKAKEIAKVESGYQKPETAARKMGEIEKAETKAETDSNTLSMKMVKDYRIIDEKKIPDEYYKPRELDLAKIRKVALAGVAIPGVEVYEKPQMASRAK